MKAYVRLLYFQFLRGVMAKTKLYTFYMSPYGAPTKHVVKMAPLVVICMPSLNLKRTKHQRSGQVYHTLLLRKAHYSSQVSRVCVASVWAEIWALLSNTLESFEQPTSSLHSTAANMADSWTYIADRDSNLPKTGHFFVASPAALVPGQLLFSRLAGLLPISPRPSHNSNTFVSIWPLYFTLGWFVDTKYQSCFSIMLM